MIRNVTCEGWDGELWCDGEREMEGWDGEERIGLKQDTFSHALLRTFQLVPATPPDLWWEGDAFGCWKVEGGCGATWPWLG